MAERPTLSDVYLERATRAMMPLHQLTFSFWAHATEHYERGEIPVEEYSSLMSTIVDCMCAQAAAPLRLVSDDLQQSCFEKILSSLKQNFTALAAERGLILDFETTLRPKLIVPS